MRQAWLRIMDALTVHSHDASASSESPEKIRYLRLLADIAYYALDETAYRGLLRRWPSRKEKKTMIDESLIGRTIHLKVANGDTVVIKLNRVGWEVTERLTSCAICTTSIDVGHSRYYSSVPGIGDLCLECAKPYTEYIDNGEEEDNG
jgi:hypothetical protein